MGSRCSSTAAGVPPPTRISCFARRSPSTDPWRRPPGGSLPPPRPRMCRGRRSTSGLSRRPRGYPSTAPSTGCARSTGTSPGTTSCAPEPSITAARACTPTPRTTRGRATDRCAMHRGPPRWRSVAAASLHSNRSGQRGARVSICSTTEPSAIRRFRGWFWQPPRAHGEIEAERQGQLPRALLRPRLRRRHRAGGARARGLGVAPWLPRVPHRLRRHLGRVGERDALLRAPRARGRPDPDLRLPPDGDPGAPRRVHGQGGERHRARRSRSSSSPSSSS